MNEFFKNLFTDDETGEVFSQKTVIMVWLSALAIVLGIIIISTLVESHF